MDCATSLELAESGIIGKALVNTSQALLIRGGRPRFFALSRSRTLSEKGVRERKENKHEKR
jgi:hypothetical protein